MGAQAVSIPAARPQPRIAEPRARPGARKQQEQHLVALWRLLDVCVAVGLLTVAFVLTNVDESTQQFGDFLSVRLTVRNVLVLAVFGWLWRRIFSAFGLYEPARLARWPSHLRRVAVACLTGGVVASVFPLLSHSGAFDYQTVALFTSAALVVTLLTRVPYHLMQAAHPASRTRLLLVGGGPLGRRFHREFCTSKDSGCELVGMVDCTGFAPPPELAAYRLGTLEDLEVILMQEVIDEVLIGLPARSHYSDIERVVDLCGRVGLPVTYCATFFAAGAQDSPGDSAPVLSTVRLEMVASDSRLVVKRAIDILGALAGLAVCAPVIAAAAIAIKLTSPGPVLFTQDRYGLKRRRFRLYKLRTMVVDAEARQAELEALNEASGPVFKIREDPRVTRVGRFLRRTSIDELPQLLNVLRGEMSLVGPRPLPPRDVHRFDQAALMRRFSVVPGITGLWQVSGRSELGFNRWIELDLEYIDRWSLALDLLILVRTLPVVLRGTGAS